MQRDPPIVQGQVVQGQVVQMAPMQYGKQSGDYGGGQGFTGSSGQYAMGGPQPGGFNFGAQQNQGGFGGNQGGFGGNNLGPPGMAGPVDPNVILCPDMPTSIRHGFVKKVYGILAVQLFLTAVIAAPLATSDAAMEWLIENRSVYYGALCVFFGLFCTLVCCEQAVRSYPKNYIAVFLLSMSLGVLIGVTCAAYDVKVLAAATGVTTAITVGLTIFAMQTSYDITGAGGYLTAFFFAIVGFGFVAAIFNFPFQRVAMAAAGSLLFSAYIVYDTQLIVGGKHKKYQFSIDDYCFAALNLYLDIINLFLCLLALFGNRE